MQTPKRKPQTKKTPVRQSKEPRRQDPYRSQTKPTGGSTCSLCQAVNIRGSWVAKEKANGKPSTLLNGAINRGKKKILCPACRQLKEAYAMGVVEIRGEKYKKNKKTVVNTLNKTEKIFRDRNDQCRILWRKEEDGILKIYVSLPELARQIGRELEKSFKGTAEYAHSTEEPYLRVRWWSDDESPAHEPGAPLSIKRRKSSAAEEHRSKAFRGRGRTPS